MANPPLLALLAALAAGSTARAYTLHVVGESARLVLDALGGVGGNATRVQLVARDGVLNLTEVRVACPTGAARSPPSSTTLSVRAPSNRRRRRIHTRTILHHYQEVENSYS